MKRSTTNFLIHFQMPKSVILKMVVIFQSTSIKKLLESYKNNGKRKQAEYKMLELSQESSY